MNRGKRGITLDLTSADGVQLVKELVRGADAVLENYSTGVLPKLGLDWARLSEVNPSLVMVSMSAYGATSQWRECRAYGSTLEHGSGLPHLAGREGDPPTMGHIAFGDAVGGLHAASALLVGLLHRHQTGIGQHVDLSQIECMMPFTAPWMMEQSATGRISPRRGNRHPDFVPHGRFRCVGEDAWVFVAVTDDAMWRACCQAIGREELSTLATAADRRGREDAIEQAITDWTMRRTPDEAMSTLQRHGVAAGAVRAPLDLYQDPHLADRGFWQTVDRAYLGPHPHSSLAFREGEKPYPVRFPRADARPVQCRGAGRTARPHTGGAGAPGGGRGDRHRGGAAVAQGHRVTARLVAVRLDHARARRGGVLLHHRAGVGVDLFHQHVIAPEIGEVLQHVARVVLVEQDAVERAVVQDQPPVAGQVDVHDLDVRRLPGDVVLPRQGACGCAV